MIKAISRSWPAFANTFIVLIGTGTKMDQRRLSAANYFLTICGVMRLVNERMQISAIYVASVGV